MNNIGFLLRVVGSLWSLRQRGLESNREDLWYRPNPEEFVVFKASSRERAK